MLKNIYHQLPTNAQALIDYYYYWRKFTNIKYPTEIGLGLSVNCQGHCIFCPVHRAKEIKSPRNMSVKLTQKVIADLVENNFSGTINISENGEALMNQKANEIISLIGNALPNCKMTLFTNMNLMDKTMAETILKAGLNHITISIDGNSNKTYQYMKGLDFGILKKNMHDFINVRDKNNYKCKIVIYVISAYNYHNAIIHDTPPFKDDTQNIVEYWSGYTRKTDVVEKLSNLGYWAISSDKKPINIKQCMHLNQISRKLLVAPNGSTYICCIDDNVRTKFGDVNNQSISEIWNSKQRLNMLKQIILRKYSLVGEPCLHCKIDENI